MGQFSNYSEYVESEAKAFVDEYEEDLMSRIKDGDTDIHEFVYDYRLHEWVDNDFIYVDLIDSAEILEQSDNVETDWGLWEGKDPQEAVKTQAFFTYRNDLGYAVMDKIESLLQLRLDDITSTIEELEEKLETEENEDTIAEIEEELDEKREFESYLEDAIESI